MAAMDPDAYVIADYLMTAATRLVIRDPAIFIEVRKVLDAFPDDAPETEAALAFLRIMEASVAFNDWKATRADNDKLK